MAVNKVVMNTENGAETLIDLTADTVTPATLAAGETAHDASGAIITGTATPVTLVQEAGESESLVMSQKAVTDALASIGQIEAPKIVSSVDEMTDPTKHYLLDGYIYHNKTVITEGETIVTYPNQFVPNAAVLNSRLSGSSGSVGTKTGYFVTDFIAVPNFARTSPYTARLNWELPYSSATDCKAVYYNSSKNRLGDGLLDADNVTSVSNGETTINLKKGYANAPTEADVAYVRLQLAVNSSLASVTSAAIANCEITFDAVYEETKTEGTEQNEWINSGITYAPTFKTDLIGVLGEGNVIYISDNALPSGTYTLKADNANYDTIGTYVVE